MVPRRILVAGIGNVFLGDDGFGVEAARRLAGRELPEGVEVADFGIRGLDLAYALQEGYREVVLLDATPRGGRPGTLYLIEARPDEGPQTTLDAHGMDPVSVLRLSRALGGGDPPRAFVVGCEPEVVPAGEDHDDMLMELSEPVRAAVDRAADLVASLLERLLAGEAATGPAPGLPTGGEVRG